MEYHVKRLLGSNPTVHFRCVQCRANLDAPLADAGKDETCPKCGVKVHVPGDAELQQRRDHLISESKKRAAEALRPTPERVPVATSKPLVVSGKPPSKYRALSVLASCYRILAALCALAGLLVLVVAIIVAFQNDPRTAIMLAVSSLVGVGVATVSLLACAEGIEIVIDIESTLRQIRDRLPKPDLVAPDFRTIPSPQDDPPHRE